MRLIIAFAVVTIAAAMPPEPDREMQGFIDGVMEAQQKAHHFAGAVCVVVRDGEVVFQRAYGFADMAARNSTSVDARWFEGGIVRVCAVGSVQEERALAGDMARFRMLTSTMAPWATIESSGPRRHESCATT
jgi:Beta-lactamase